MSTPVAPASVIESAADKVLGYVSSRSLARTMRKRAAVDNSGATVVEPSFEECLEEDARAVYKRPWNRLESGMKWIKLREFCGQFATANKLTESEKALLTSTMRKMLDAKLLNTKQQVEYLPEEERISTVFGLHELPRNDKGDRRFALARASGRGTRKKHVAHAAMPAAAPVAPTTASQSEAEVVV